MMDNKVQIIKHVACCVYFADTSVALQDTQAYTVTGVVENAVVVNSEGDVDKCCVVQTTTTGELLLLHTF